jgi:acetyltransferase-like isoleucine patch superfamily enzyme
LLEGKNEREKIGGQQNTVKIAFSMINCNRRDGSARAVNEVAERLAGRVHDVHLFARKAKDLDLNKIRWHKVPGPGWPEVANFWTYHVQVNRSIPDRFFDCRGHLAIGENSVINQRCRLDARGGLIIGANVSISPEVHILSADHDVSSIDFSGRTR